MSKLKNTCVSCNQVFQSIMVVFLGISFMWAFLYFVIFSLLAYSIVELPCNLFDWQENYDDTPSSHPVIPSFLKYPENQGRWISAIPTNRESLEILKEIHICYHHLDYDWIIVQGGVKRSTQSASIIFPEIPKSHLKTVINNTKTN